MGTDRLDEILDAAFTCLGRYGARRTTMDDIASEMGVSRSALYQYVRNKDDAFQRLAERLHEQAFERARLAAVSDRPLPERIHAVLTAKLDLARMTGDSPHSGELLDDTARLFGEICRDFTTRLRDLLAGLFSEGGAYGPRDAAEICLALAAGLKHHQNAPALLRTATDALIPGLLTAR